MFDEVDHDVSVAIPQHYCVAIPPHKLAVVRLLKWTLPLQDKVSLIPYKASLCFSVMPPGHIDLFRLTNTDIPANDFLKDLAASMSQAWSDKKQSFTYPSLGTGLPFWVILWWKEMAKSIAGKQQWEASVRWLGKQSANTLHTHSTLISDSRNMIQSLGWNSPSCVLGQEEISMGTDDFTTAALTRFLGDGWMSGTLMNMMIAYIELHVHNDKVWFGDSWVYEHFERIDKNSYKPKRKGFLHNLEESVKTGDKDELVFPYLISNHWHILNVNFKSHEILTGETLNGEAGSALGLAKKIQTWALNSLNLKFTIDPLIQSGGSLSHGVQQDSFSCGIGAINIIAHKHLGHQLWTPAHAIPSRLQWFLIIARAHTITSMTTTTTAPSRSRMMDLAQICAPNPPPRANELTSSRSADEADVAMEDACLNGASDTAVLHEAAPAAAALEFHEKTSERVLYSIFKNVPTHEKPELAMLNAKVKPGKRPLSPTRTPSAYSDDLTSRQSTKKKAKTTYLDLLGPTSFSASGAPIGHSYSVGETRKDKARVNDPLNGVITISSDRRYAKWRESCQRLDANVEFPADRVIARGGRPSDFEYRQVIHMGCTGGKPTKVLVKSMYDVTRFRKHVNDCNKKSNGGGCQTLTSMAWKGGWSETVGIPPKETRQVPCPGLPASDHTDVAQYLRRTAAPGGGARGLGLIADEKFQTAFRELTTKEKNEVLAEQILEHKWRNDHLTMTVHSSKCHSKVTVSVTSSLIPSCIQCSMLAHLNDFSKATKRPIPNPRNYIHLNQRYRHKTLGKLYAAAQGLEALMNDGNDKNTPCVRYALGVLSGQYVDHKVFTGMVMAMVQKVDKDKRQVGRQGSVYTQEYYDFCQLMAIMSPRTYKFFSERIPAPTIRSMQIKRSHQPRVSLDIGDTAFNRVKDHLDSIGYEGPLGLSCDDTKLLASFRLYWDSSEDSHFLAGAVGGPIRVADPERVQSVLDDATIQKASKIRVWCIQVPIPKVTPIIVAALPIISMSALELVERLDQVLRGLLERNLCIISYACDGTEVERSVQRLMIARSTCNIIRTIPNPLFPSSPLVISIPTIHGQPMAMIQDSLHDRKSMRNNAHSGARLITLGNTVVLYSQIRAIAYAEHGYPPLYKRDVEKVDRQDDAAASRLFGAATLQHVISNDSRTEGDRAALIVYLFVFGELVDAYQSRNMLHIERVRIAIRASLFLDAWEAFLTRAHYVRAKHFISRESADIARILIKGILSLIYIHRDILLKPYPLLPWLHSSESCEHIFGVCRQMVKDFTMLDFHQMMPKLTLQLREHVLRGHASNPKSKAGGYSHTYFDLAGIDVAAISTFPDDAAILKVATVAGADVEALLAILGLDVLQLRGIVVQPLLPRIRTRPGHFKETMADDSESDSDDEINNDEPTEECEATELQALIDQEENRSSQFHNQRTETDILNLTFASVALGVHQSMHIDSYAEPTDEEADEFCAEDMAHIGKMLSNRLPAVNVPRVAYNPITFDLDLSPLVQLRQLHETAFTARGIRTQKATEILTPCAAGIHNVSPAAPVELKRDLLRRFRTVLAQEERGVGTGLERERRWRDAAPGGRDGVVNGEKVAQLVGGNSLNAADAAGALTKILARKRSKVYSKINAPWVTPLIDGRISVDTPLLVGQYGFVLIESKLMIGRVLSIYSKTGGTNGCHAARTESSNISAVSNLPLQVYQYQLGLRFRAIHFEMSALHVNKFALIPARNFLCLLQDFPQVIANQDLNISRDDGITRETFTRHLTAIIAAVKTLGVREKKAAEDNSSMS